MGSWLLSIEQTSQPWGNVKACEEGCWVSTGDGLRRADLNEGGEREGLALASEEGTNSRASGLRAEAMAGGSAVESPHELIPSSYSYTLEPTEAR